jgi:Spy/CpxP family protein refolding chaperone
MVKKMLVLFSVFLNIGFLAVAGYTILHHKGFMHKKYHRGMMHIELFQKLNLSPEQNTDIDTFVSRYMTDMDAVSERSFQEKSAFFKTLGSAGSMNDQAVDRHLKSIFELEVEREVIKYNHLKNIKKILNDEQAESFFNMLIRHTGKRYESRAQREK